MSFHLSIPVRSLRESEAFYVNLLGARIEHRDVSGYVNIDLRGTQITLHEQPDFEVPPGELHFGVNLGLAEFQALAAHVEAHAPDVIIMKPKAADAGTPLERWKMYVRCPSGWLVELKGRKQNGAHVRLWRYQVESAKRGEFVKHYHADGSWAQLFRQAPGYLGTQLWADEKTPGVYYTADYWRDRSAFANFQKSFRAQYETLDAEFENLTLGEEFLGAGDSVIEEQA